MQILKEPLQRRIQENRRNLRQSEVHAEKITGRAATRRRRQAEKIAAKRREGVDA